MPTAHKRTPQPPQPPPLPPTPPTTTDSCSPASAHRRHLTFSSSSSSSSSLSTGSSAASSPSPSPRGRSATSVPFSWEHHPGIPKTPLPAIAGAAASSSSSSPPPTAPLPLPPPLRAPPSRSRHHHHHHQQTRRRRPRSQPPADAADPFAAALAKCTRERAAGAGDRRLMDTLFPSLGPASASAAAAASVPSAPSRRWSIASAGGVVGLLDLYGCKCSMGVAEGAFVVRRPVAVPVVRHGPGRAGLGRAGRR